MIQATLTLKVVIALGDVPEPGADDAGLIDLGIQETDGFSQTLSEQSSKPRPEWRHSARSTDGFRAAIDKDDVTRGGIGIAANVRNTAPGGVWTGRRGWNSYSGLEGWLCEDLADAAACCVARIVVPNSLTSDCTP
jgi:hypothetical protein